MKQYIKVQQFYELSDRAKITLDIWCEDKKYPASGLSIGQMIEFLDDYMKTHRWKEGIEIDKGEDYWHIYAPCKEYKYIKSRYESEVLCDALWEAVKEVLEAK